MSETDKNRICPVERSGSLDNRWRKILQNPRRILKPYIQKDMKILDFGCGPGFFSLEIARMLGNEGQVFAADLQEGMLEIVRNKIKDTAIEERIILHKCEPDKCGLKEKLDFILAFYVVHEVPERKALFAEFHELLNPGAKLMIIEPKFHVSKKEFEITKGDVTKAGFVVLSQPKIFISRAALFQETGRK